MTVARSFGRDLGRTLAKLEAMLAGARRDGIDLLVLPGATHSWPYGDPRGFTGLLDRLPG